MKITFTAILFAAAAAVLSLSTFAQDGKKKAQDVAEQRSEADLAVIAAQLPSYPLDTCVVSGEPLDAMGGPFEHVHDGRLVRICCKPCIKGIERNTEAIFAKIDAAVVAAQGPSYPLETCPVSGEPLEGDRTPVDIVHGTRLVRVCCKGCVRGFHKNPAAALAVVDAAYMEAQRASYPLTTCVVSDEALGSMGDPVELLYGTQLVRLCCKGCARGFQRDPAAFAAKVVAARAAADKEDGDKGGE